MTPTFVTEGVAVGVFGMGFDKSVEVCKDGAVVATVVGFGIAFDKSVGVCKDGVVVATVVGFGIAFDKSVVGVCTTALFATCV